MYLPRATLLSRPVPPRPFALFHRTVSFKSLNQREGKPAFACLVGNLKLDMIPGGLTPISVRYCILGKVSSLLPRLRLLPYFVPLLLLHFRPAKKRDLTISFVEKNAKVVPFP
jgi:hypothetical protein